MTNAEVSGTTRFDASEIEIALWDGALHAISDAYYPPRVAKVRLRRPSILPKCFT
jgi:hypothetical protein